MPVHMIVSQTLLSGGGEYEPPEPGACVVELETDCTCKRDILVLASKMSGMADAVQDNRDNEKPPWYGWTVETIPTAEVILEDMIHYWHESDEDISLIEHLGFTWEEYSAFVERREIPEWFKGDWE